jgi:S-adenosylmethionine synthetase
MAESIHTRHTPTVSGAVDEMIDSTERARSTRDSFVLDESTVVVDRTTLTPCNLSIVERKGWGHPDTLADHLAEQLSRAYSRYTLQHFGAVLHHNFDKLALLGGASEVRYGSGRMAAPVRVLVNGRAARSCGGTAIPVEDLITDEVTAFFKKRLPELEGQLRIELNVTSNASPGAVITGTATTDREKWFAPKSVDDLRERRRLFANDTSLGTGFAPPSKIETFVRTLADYFSGPDGFRTARPWCGSDVKVMAHGLADELDVVLAAPQKSPFVASRTEYLANKDEVLAECKRLAARDLPGVRARFRLNARDIPERDELYLTYTGSSIESGDEGVVGRGNRVNGLITPLRPMNLEGANGKNPTYHVGKLYNVAANRIAERLHEATGNYAEVHLISATGQRLDRPWRIVVRLAKDGDELPQDKLTALLLETLDSFPALTTEILTDNELVLA